MNGSNEGPCDAMVSDYFNDDGSPKKCPKCGSSNFTEKILGVVDVYCGMGPACEAEYFCECGDCVGFWAYGDWNPDRMHEFIVNNPAHAAAKGKV